MKLPPRPASAVDDCARVLPPWHRVGRGGSGITTNGGRESLVGQQRGWVVGECWRCDGADLPVMWLGPVHSVDHGQGPFYACDPCIRRLEERVAAYGERRDTPA